MHFDQTRLLSRFGLPFPASFSYLCMLKPATHPGMLKRNLSTLFIVLMISLTVKSPAQVGEGFSVVITPWYQDRSGAVSFSFDDAGMTQYTDACPILEKYGIRGTFSVVGEWVGEEASFSAEPGYFAYSRMGWKQLVELLDHGHELAAHGMVHERYDKFSPVDTLAGQMRQIRSLIREHTGQEVLTLHYPYSFASGNIPLAAVKAGFLFCRSGLDTVNGRSPENMCLLASQAILNEEIPDSALFNRWLDQAQDGWLILMYHNLFADSSREMSLYRLHDVAYTYSLTPRAFERQVGWAASRNCWLAPIAEVGKYIRERDNTELNITQGKGKIRITLLSKLDKAIYTLPLTLRINLPWDKVRVSGSLQDGILHTGGNLLLLDVVPGSVITLYKEK